MGMKGVVCSLSPERLRILLEDPELVNDLSDRRVEVPGRLFYDALRALERLRTHLPGDAGRVVVATLSGEVGTGIGERGGWAYGRPHVVDGDDLVRLRHALDALGATANIDAEPDVGAIELELAEQDDAFLVSLADLVRRESGRGGALLVHIT